MKNVILIYEGSIEVFVEIDYILLASDRVYTVRNHVLNRFNILVTINKPFKKKHNEYIIGMWSLLNKC